MYCVNKDAQRTFSKALTAVLYGVLLCIVTFYIAVTIMAISSEFIWLEYAVGDKQMEIKSGTWYINTTHSEPREPMLMTQEKLESFKLYPHNYGSHLQPWRPKFGEWCWFYNTGDTFSVLRQFVKMSEENFYLANNIVCDWAYECCEPFIGKLPTFLKDNS